MILWLLLSLFSVLFCANFFNGFDNDFHLIMPHTIDYYISILNTLYYMLLAICIHIPTLYVYGFLIFARSLFLAAIFLVVGRLLV